MSRPGVGRAVLVALLAVLGSLAAPGPAATAAACQAQGAIGDYWRSVGADSSFLGPCLTSELPVPAGVVQHFRGGSVYWSNGTGARSVRDAIRAAYDAVSGPSSRLGLPTTSETATPIRHGAYNHFTGGSIYWSPGTGARLVVGAIRESWARQGWENGRLGFPTTSETATPIRHGAYNHFTGGSIYWSPGTGARLVVGAIRESWARQGWENGRLGFPLTDETATGEGAFSVFQGGSVYWSPATGAQVVSGSIREHWISLGAEHGRLGFPVTSDQPTPIKAGAYNHFTGGSVYWSPTTPARMVVGAIRDRWAALGWENGALGFPVSDEYSVDGGARSDFSGGSITWDARTGTTTVRLGPRPSFTFAVQQVTAADLPTTYRTGCPVLPQDLRMLRMSYTDFAGIDRAGAMVVHADQVTPVLKVFAGLHEWRFPIARMQPVDAFGGSDAASMDANNTSAFNCRRTTGGTAWSEHAYGRALDVNPVQNPYVSGSTVLPEAGRAYLDRTNRRPGMVSAGDGVVRAFAAQGWVWGGTWTNPRDYQHFSRSGR